MTEDSDFLHRRWLAIFEDRHGPGAYERLLADLQQPCVTFAEIARRLNVSRERVRQWQRRILPDAPRGHERQRLCTAQRRKRRLLTDSLFRAFYRHARPFLERGRIELLRASDGYRTRSARIDGRVVVLRNARQSPDSRSASGAVEYLLSGSPGRAEFVYYRLTDQDYLLVPALDVPASGTTYVDGRSSPFAAFRNTFQALGGEAPR